MDARKPTLYLLDSYGLIYRSYFAFISRPLSAPDGANVSAVFGFFRFLFSIFDRMNPGAFAAVFDSRVPTFRHELYADYKATRQKTPEDLHAQVPLVEEGLKLLGVPILRNDGYEADDLIACLAERCRAEGRECRVISADKDLLQLVGGPVRALRPEKDSVRELGPADVLEEWGVEPERILDYLSLTGDSSDNVPGVPGIGDKTAAKLLAEFRDLDDIYARLSDVKPEGVRRKLEAGRESAYFSRRLITLASTCPTGVDDLGSLELTRLDRAAANPLWKRLGMRSLVSGGETGDLFGTKAAAPTPHTPKPASPSGPRELPPSTLPAALSGEGAYEAVTDAAALRRWLAAAKAAGVVAFDCETESLDEFAATPVGFSLAVEPRKACYVPVRSPDSSCVPEAELKAALSELFADPALQVVGHNLKFDLHVLENWGVPVAGPARDTMVAAWMLDPDRAGLGLEALAEKRLGIHGLEFGDVVPKGATFAMVPIDKALRYAAEDADFTLRLWKLFEPELDAAGLLGLYRDVEMPLLPLLARMERAGILVDADELEKYGVELEDGLEEVQREAWKLVGHEFNLASPKQLQEVLFVERKLAAGKKTKSGYSTDVSVLEELAAEDPVPALILKHRSMAKLKGTYVDALGELARAEARVRTHFVQTGAATGRLSSRDPNLQNIPIREEEGRRIRRAFMAPPGRLLVSADYAQIELVVFAHLSGDPELRRAFVEGADVHRRTAALIFGVPEEAVSGEQRRVAKTINFGVIYGMRAFRLAGELKIPRGEAQRFIDAYFERYAGVRRFIDETVAACERDGSVRTMLGRRRPVADINSGNKTVKQAAERVAVNTPIQGSAADIVKLAMLRVDRALREAFPSARMLLQVHDELIVEADAAEAGAVAALVKAEMEKAVELSVPLRASVETGERWGDFH